MFIRDSLTNSTCVFAMGIDYYVIPCLGQLNLKLLVVRFHCVPVIIINASLVPIDHMSIVFYIYST